jgi:hypothetical protein
VKRLFLGLAMCVAMMPLAYAGGSLQPPPVDKPPAISPDRNFRGGFIDRQTAIEMCVEDVQDVQISGEVPEVFARHKRYLRGVKHQLQKEGFKNWKDMMWGAAIKICMQDEGYRSICVSKSGREGDLQFLETAKAPSCWDLAAVEEQVIPPEVVVPPPPPPVLAPPPMSPDDLAQFNEDMGIISSPPTVVYGYHSQGERFASCASYWQSLHHNRPPQVRQVLYSVRVARCMYRTGFGFLQSGCNPDFSNMLNPRCYARF